MRRASTHPLLFLPRPLRLPSFPPILWQVPEGVDWAAVCKNAMDKFNVEIAGGLGPTIGKVSPRPEMTACYCAMPPLRGAVGGRGAWAVEDWQMGGPCSAQQLCLEGSHKGTRVRRKFAGLPAGTAPAAAQFRKNVFAGSKLIVPVQHAACAQGC
jgi:hypothetical protein